MKNLIMALFMLVTTLHSQVLVNGFEKKISGPEIDYHSAHPQANHALITRATDGKMKIEWQTAKLPKVSDQQKIKIIWLAGLGCNLGEYAFNFYVNDEPILQFKSWNKDAWQVSGKHGYQLKFNGLMVDKYGDRMGIMELIVPTNQLHSGKPLKLAITGAAAASQAWVMVFQYPLKNEVQVQALPALIRKQDNLLQPIKIIHTFLDQSARVKIEIDGQTTLFNARYGINQYEIFLSPVEENQTKHLKLTIKGQVFEQKFVQKPVRRWTIFLVQHSHTDIGYTRPQQEILAEHLRYIDTALELCDQTDHLPEEAKFRWTCEATWPVREYLLSRPQKQIERLKKRILDGRIELTGMMFNMSELADENLLNAFLQPIKTIKSFGLPVKTAMQNDVNGFAWALVDYFPDLGIKYVTMGENTHRALKPFKHPTPFWWRTRAGNKVLAFRADHYMVGNFFANQAGDLSAVEKDLFNYLNQLQQANYPYDEVEMQHSGYFTDNSPPSSFVCEMVQKWNQKYAYPQVRTATISQFMNLIEQKHCKEFPEFQLAWPDWWTDGFASAARETEVARQTQGDLLTVQNLLSAARLIGLKTPLNLLQDLQKTAENLLFWSEHTFGAAESISDPLAENSINQWMIKASFAWKSQWQTYLLKQKAIGLFLPILKGQESGTVFVFNPLNWKRSDAVTVYIDKQLLPPDQKAFLRDEQGRKVPLQMVGHRAEGNYWTFLSEDIPPLSWKAYSIEVQKESGDPQHITSNNVLENQFYRVEFDTETGSLKRLTDLELGKELVDPDAPWGFAQFIYERLSDRHAMELLQLGDAERTIWKNVRIKENKVGPVWQSLTIQGQSPAAVAGYPVELEIRLFNHQKRIDFIYRLRKKRVHDPEAIYLAFPFHVPKGRIYFEAQGAIIEAGVDQLPGTANDWNTVQSFAAARNADFQVVLSSVDCPLMQFGNINTGRYQYQAKPEQPHIYAWPLNNYWTTNFKDSQEGDLQWRFSLTSSADVNNQFASRFGWNLKVPMATLIKTTEQQQDVPAQNVDLSFLNQSGLLLIKSQPLPDSDLVLLALREIEGKKVRLRIPDSFTGYESNVLGEQGKKINQLNFKPFEVGFVLLKKKEN